MPVAVKPPRYIRLSLTQEQFDKVLPFANQKATMLEGAKLVFVDGVSLSDAARQLGFSRQNLDQGLKKFLTAYARSIEVTKNAYSENDVIRVCTEHQLGPLTTEIMVLRVVNGFTTKAIISGLSAKYPGVTVGTIYRTVRNHIDKFPEAINMRSVEPELIPVDGSAYPAFTPEEFRVATKYADHNLPQLAFLFQVLVKRTVAGKALPRKSVSEAHAYVAQKYPDAHLRSADVRSFIDFLESCKQGAPERPVLMRYLTSIARIAIRWR